MESKTKQLLTGVLFWVGFLNLSLGSLQGQGVGVSFHPIDIPQGYSLIANPHFSSSNRILDLIQGQPDGLEVIKLTGDTWQTNRYSAETRSWSLSAMTLTPGEGALVNSPEAFTWNSIGKPLVGKLENYIPAGTSLRSSILPLEGLISSTLDFPPLDGLILSTVDPADGTFSVLATYENDAWQPTEPVLPIGKAFLVDAPSGVLWTKDFQTPDDDNPLSVVTEPQDLELMEGGEISLSVEVDGATDLRYQWQLNGNDIEGATETTYTVESALPTMSGSYSAVVYSKSHSVRSRQATVLVTAKTVDPEPNPPTGLTVTVSLNEDGSQMIVTISGDPGKAVQVETTPTLSGQEWTVKADDLVIGETGQATHTETVEIGKSLFVRALAK